MLSNYALLSVRNNPLLVFLLEKLNQNNCLPKVIIFDNKNLSQEELLRFCDRTGYSINDFSFSYNKFNLTSFYVDDHNSKETISIIEKLKINFLVNAGTPRILKNPIITKTPLGILNCHPGILPFFKGCSCVEWSIYEDQPVGNSIHWMDESIDSGPLIATKITKCFISDNYQDIRKRVYHDGFLFLSQIIKEISNSSNNQFIKKLKGKSYTGGRYYKPMDKILLDEVKLKINQKLYKYQF